MGAILLVPPNDGSVKGSYYLAYFLSCARWAKAAEIEVRFTRDSRVWPGGDQNAFSCVFKVGKDDPGRQFIMDFSDFKPLRVDPRKYGCAYFKWRFSYDSAEHMSYPNVFPAAFVLRFDFATFDAIRQRVRYTGRGKYIINNQTPRRAAKERRESVQTRLKARYGNVVSTKIIAQEEWWKLHGNCLLAVNTPGARIDVLDKGHLEQMGLGVCVLSPPIRTVFPGYRCLQPWIHYVPLRPDFGDLIDKIEFCRKNPVRCCRIGQAARELFDATVPPVPYWAWIKKCLREYNSA